MMINKTPSPSKAVGQSIRGAFRALETANTRALNKCGVRYSHFQILHILWHGDGLTQGELANASFITDSSFAQVITEMEKEGFVERRVDRNDARKRLIYLTPKGTDAEDQLAGVISEIMEVAQSGFTKDELNLLLRMNHQIRKNLDEAFTVRRTKTKPKTSA